MISIRRYSCLCTRRKLRLSYYFGKWILLSLFLVTFMCYLLLYGRHGSDNIFMIAQNEMKDDILNLNGVDDFQFQGEENFPPSSDKHPYDEASSKQVVISNISYESYEKRFSEKSTFYTPDGNVEIRKKVDPTLMRSTYVFKSDDETQSYLFILGHYEQLGKTTINFLHARYLASLLGRHLVLPFVRNSRFCGLEIGWRGPKRKKSREFLVMDNYFNMASVEKLLPIEPMTNLVHWADFYDVCFASGLLMIYFVYAGDKTEMERFFQLSDSEYDGLLSKLKENNGWCDCLFIEKKFNTGKRMNNMRFSHAICIDPEIMQSVSKVEELTNANKCAVIFSWRGIGHQRTHFNLTLPYSHEIYLSQLEFSDLVLREVDAFLLTNFQAGSYLSIQIRSERQLAWYSLKKFKQCLDLVVKVVDILMLKKKIKHVFISSDLEKHGSDQISVLLNSTTHNQAKVYFEKTVKLLNGVLYKPDKSRGLIFNDAGFVALTQMELLSRSRHLVTLGAGTFQSWLVALFKKHKKKLKRSWSLTRVCATELKKSPTRNNIVTPSTPGKVRS